MGKKIVDADELIRSLNQSESDIKVQLRRMEDVLKRMQDTGEVKDALYGCGQSVQEVREELLEGRSKLEGQVKQISETIELVNGLAKDAAPAQEEKCGHWEIVPAKSFWASPRFACSVCGHEDYHGSKCCPNCGSRNK